MRPGRAGARVRAAYARIAEVDRPEVWIDLLPFDDALRQAEEVDRRRAAGERLPLAGRTLAVKGNIDVAGLVTTAGCPGYGVRAAVHAPAVQRLVDAGAVVLGTTNLDQFATGLVGTRSPHGAVRDAHRPGYVSGGSSSGSAVAVALGIADLALGTDTAGSGRVPAAFAGIVGLKPTRGLIPTVGVVPACRELDCVSVFAADLPLAELAAALAGGPADGDPTARRWPPDAPLAGPPAPCVAVPALADLPELSADAARAFVAATRRLEAAGAVVVPVDLAPFLAAGRLLYGGGFVAQRYAAVGEFLDAPGPDRPGVDPVVAGIVRAAAEVPAHRLVADVERLDRLRADVAAALAGADALLLPTVPRQPTIAEVAADPVGVNAALGVWTACCNLLDLSAVAVPAGTADGGRFGVTVLGRAFADRLVADVARMLTDDVLPVLPEPADGLPEGIPLVVLGAHLTGQPLNGQLTAAGARLARPIRTAPRYRLFALDTRPAKPGLVEVADGGVAVTGELWLLPPLALARLLATLPPPLALGPVELGDGTAPVGFRCEAAATAGCRDISRYGGWREYLAQGGAHVR